MTHLHINAQVIAKRRVGSQINTLNKKPKTLNWQFDSQPLKVWNHPDFLVCRWHVTYCWKAFEEGYNFASNFISIGGLCAKLWAPKL
jgi:hypothetical protein